MKNPTDHITESARGVQLSDEAKSRIREHIRLHMQLNPMPVATPYAPHLGILSPFFSRHLQAVALVLVLIVAVGGGTAYAAEGALPGDTLYPIKTGVVEPARRLLAVTEQAKVNVNVSIALTRLHEAEQLSSESRLTKSSSEEIQQSFNDSMNNAQVHIVALKEQDPEEAQKASAYLDLSLGIHEAVLTDLHSATTSEQSSRISALVETIKTETARHQHDATTTVEALQARLGEIRSAEHKILSNLGVNIFGGASSTASSTIDVPSDQQPKKEREHNRDSKHEPHSVLPLPIFTPPATTTTSASNEGAVNVQISSGVTASSTTSGLAPVISVPSIPVTPATGITAPSVSVPAVTVPPATGVVHGLGL